MLSSPDWLMNVCRRLTCGREFVWRSSSAPYSNSPSSITHRDPTPTETRWRNSANSGKWSIRQLWMQWEPTAYSTIATLLPWFVILLTFFFKSHWRIYPPLPHLTHATALINCRLKHPNEGNKVLPCSLTPELAFACHRPPPTWNTYQRMEVKGGRG